MTHASRPLLYLLLAAALFMRAFLPQGTMPERSDSGAIAVALCASGGVHLIPLNGDADPEEERQRAEPPCAFAGLATPTVPPTATLGLPLPQAGELAFADHFAAARFPAPSRLHPPARGPPQSA